MFVDFSWAKAYDRCRRRLHRCRPVDGRRKLLLLAKEITKLVGHKPIYLLLSYCYEYEYEFMNYYFNMHQINAYITQNRIECEEARHRAAHGYLFPFFSRNNNNRPLFMQDYYLFMCICLLCFVRCINSRSRVTDHLL